MATYNNTIVLQFDTSANGNAGAGKKVTVLIAGTQAEASLTDKSGNDEFGNANNVSLSC